MFAIDEMSPLILCREDYSFVANRWVFDLLCGVQFQVTIAGNILVGSYCNDSLSLRLEPLQRNVAASLKPVIFSAKFDCADIHSMRRLLLAGRKGHGTVMIDYIYFIYSECNMPCFGVVAWLLIENTSKRPLQPSMALISEKRRI